MFSVGHLLWITISLFLIVFGLIFCRIRSPRWEDLVKCCFWLGLLSELVKIFSVTEILPIVEPVLSGASVSYKVSGTYSPYLENADLPFELCSLQIPFYALVIWCRDPKWKRRFTSLIFVTGIIGGTLGILLAYIAPEHPTVRDFFTSPRAWQYFLYHAMVVTAGINAGFRRDSTVSLRDLKGVLAALASLDIITLYLNSIFSEPVYVSAKPVGLLYRANFFSSYVNPIGLVLTEKWQWIVYLIVRLLIAVITILLLFLIQNIFQKMKTLGKEMSRG